MGDPGGLIEWCLWGGVVTRPLWRLAGRVLGAVFGFVYKWAVLVRVCLRRYRRFVNGPSVCGPPPAEKIWKMFEALWATPIVFGFKSSVKYWIGSKTECRRTAARACCACRGFWAFASLLLYTLFFTVVFLYDFVEKVCQGTVGVSTLLLVLNVALAEGELSGSDGLAPGEMVSWGSGAVVLAGAASSLLKWYEGSSEGRSPVKMAEDRYAAWVKDVEEQEQADRLSEAFWEADGCIGVKKPVRTLSGLYAQQRDLRARMRADQKDAARRGRRVSVGEGVPSGTKGNRLGHGGDRSLEEGLDTCTLLREDQLREDELTDSTERGRW
ncbi:hypothetical protein PF004_g7020 [Phytophthora fragariae]|uniref:Transmembrane protein n=1 Tax=Phytophthora fragariae TaxID=53985 RepID=A0A6G0PAZ1_9STRA|nr:hypothetical protein PF004_g7020 [Phytophthora fragariae]